MTTQPQLLYPGQPVEHFDRKLSSTRTWTAKLPALFADTGWVCVTGWRDRTGPAAVRVSTLKILSKRDITALTGISEDQRKQLLANCERVEQTFVVEL